MERTLARTAFAVAACLPLISCRDFLSGPGLSTDPNVPTTATTDQLWAGVQVTVMQHFENQLSYSMWAQQINGTTTYAEGATDYSTGSRDSYAAQFDWGVTYGPGGLIDLRSVESGAAAESNYRLRGEARVLEALTMGTAADIFGGVPYTTALSARPTFDTQAQVFAHVQAVLDSAIKDLDSTGFGAKSVDFFYGNDFAAWKAAAHSLKARFFMHRARSDATTYIAAILDSVRSHAALGISAPSGDLQVNHTSGSAADVNPMYFPLPGGAIAPSAILIALMRDAGEEYLLPVYYRPNTCCAEFFGILPDESHNSDSLSTFAAEQLSPTKIVTFAENAMLLAEAQYRLGDLPAARATLDAYRDSIGAPLLPALSPIPLLEAILREKTIQALPNIEHWNDYLRTCYPNFQLPRLATALNYVPARMPVAYNEQVANGANVPEQPPNNPGNPNDPKNYFAIDGVTPCHGQVNRPY